jgi:hypothetical protein
VFDDPDVPRTPFFREASRAGRARIGQDAEQQAGSQ